MYKASNLLLSAILCLSLFGLPAIAQKTTTSIEKGAAKTEKATKKETKTEAKSAKESKSTAEKPAKLQISLTNFTQTVKQGEKASVSVKTDAGARCSIAVKLKSGLSKAADLKAQKADAAGSATWNWTIAKNTSPGDVPFTVTASLKGEKAEASGVIKVEAVEAAPAAGAKGTKKSAEKKTEKTEKKSK